ncbi:hypothetical protein ACTXT7_009767 [Hymenolepis weldensis]
MKTEEFFSVGGQLEHKVEIPGIGSTEMRKGQRKGSSRHDSYSRNSRPELEEFFESVHERMKNLAIAQKLYKARNDKELSVQPGDFFEAYCTLNRIYNVKRVIKLID